MSLRSKHKEGSLVAIELLDPTLDITFKLLLLRNQDLLRDMIEAVLDPPVPLSDLIVLNPEIPKDFPGDKAIVLDIRARFHGGHQVDLEMQTTSPPGTRSRFLYYWAKAFSDGLGNGARYSTLRPCISILWFKTATLESAQFHSIFHLSEDVCGEVFCPDIEFHVLELTKLHLASPKSQAKLERWARFLRARSVEVLEELAREDTVMNAAKNALCELSLDSNAQRLAREREMAMVAHRHLMGASYEAGEAKGRVEGEAKGRAQGLLVAIDALCRMLGIELDSAKSDQLSLLDAEQLERFVEQLERERRWPTTP